MSLLIHIEDLLKAHKVESERIEFKKGWNPNPIMRAICAFANDFDNIGSGYILIGVAEDEGVALRPVTGVLENKIDKILQELHKYSRLISPDYFPRVSVEEVDEKKIIAIWCPAGSNRPYKVPDEVTAKKRVFNHRIRWGSSSIIPNGEQAIELLQLTAKIPFDDRVNQQASVEDLDFGLMREHLARTHSRLFDESTGMSREELAEKMNLTAGADEHLFPKNVGLLMFSLEPTKFFKSAHIDIVEFPDGEGGATLLDQEFKGPIQLQLQDALDYLDKSIVKSKTIKSDYSAKAPTIYNYSFVALEEAISNAVYHRNYEESEPIEIRILPDRVVVTSYNGADPALKQIDFDKGTIRARRYRNRRIGEFLKELELTEGRGTGIPRLQRALDRNGFLKAVFDVDDPNRRYFVIEILIHPDFLGAPIGIMKGLAKVVGLGSLTHIQIEVLNLIFTEPEMTYSLMADQLNISESAVRKRMDGLKSNGTVERIGTKSGYWKINFNK